MPSDAAATIEERLRAIEDRLEIYNLIASHPPSADTGAKPYIESIFTEDAVLDLGGAKIAAGSSAISEMSQRPAHQDAIKAGLAHFAGLPHVTIDGDRAVVTSYLQIITPHPTADETEVPAHGVSRGHRIHRVGANRWELVRTPQGWKIKRRAFRTLDGSPAALDILRQALAPPGTASTNA
jgi:SnoaL-like domain